MNEDYSKIFDKIYEEREPNFNESINIAFVGKVSTGKSSLINAVMLRDRGDPIVEVGATSGVTTEVKAFRLDDHVLIIDSPGLDDIRKENSEETRRFLSNIDLGIMVVTGSADSSQKRNYEDLRSNAKKVFVVLNKIDEWDDLDESALTDVIEQWKKELGVNHIYPTCTKGYDPRLKKDAPMDIRGVEDLNENIWGYLRREGKDLLLTRHLGDKRKYAAAIISTALVAVAGEAFIPGSAAYITATQAIAITSLYYLYTGKVLAKGNALALLPTFMGESIGVTVFLWIKSFLPPTGVVDIAAAGVAVGITFAMLAAVTYLLSAGFEIDQRKALKEKFKEYKNSTPTDFTEKVIDAIKNGGSIKDMVYKLIFA
ncbi:GTPase [Aeromonas dhakensis]|uniref:GTPase n=1 Tax=Aeromonas dhakensis TaxID=196024 RepID=UPI003B9FE205